MRISKWMVAGLMLASLPVMAGEVYKWVDAGGRIHYGDQPQPGWKRVEVKAPGTIPALPAAAKGVDTAAARAACEGKRKELASYKGATRIVEKDTLGREKEYSEEDRKKLIDMTQKQADQACSGQPPPETAAAEPAEPEPADEEELGEGVIQ